jgi:uncharacterized membrane protein
MPTNPCKNGGTCADGINKFTCTCPANYTGTTCQTDVNECMPTNPCLHGGACANTTGSFSCDCTGTGYSGTTCQTDVNECMPTNPCKNSASCTNTTGSYTCACAARFTGKNCEFQRFRGMGVLALDDMSAATAVSADGNVVVGYSGLTGQAFTSHAVRMVGTAALQYLTTPAGSESCDAEGVSGDGGVIVGNCDSTMPAAGLASRRPFRYTPATNIQYMNLSPLAADTDVNMQGISDDGNVIIGYILPSQAARWTAASGWTLLGKLSPAGDNIPHGVNRDGSIIVGMDAPSASIAWRWTAATGEVEMTRPGTADASFYAFDINATGTIVVGYNYEFSTSSSSVIRWTNGTPSNLGAGYGYGVSADGTVVVGEGASGAMVWNPTPHTLVSLLNSTTDLSGWTLQHASDVSDDGKVVVGWGQHNGKQEGFVAHLP